jgi:manganese oxidase
VAINIVNHSHEPAAIHWHGIELESYPDGVPGWSGEGDRVLPAIPVGDSLTVRFTPPRAGTFMYHSHFNEMQQIASGMYGAIIVLEPGERHDPELDRLLVFSDGGPFLDFGPGMRVPPKFLNGRADPEPLRLRAGTTYRLRLINIITETGLELVLLDGDTPVSWRAVAKDGAELPPGLATMRPAELVFSPGEIYDFELAPTAAGELRLGFLRAGGIPDEWTWARVEVR